MTQSKLSVTLLATLAVGMLSATTVCAAQLQTTFRGNRPIAITGLVEQDGCFPARITGRVVKREFNNNGLVVQSVTLEEASGERTFVNVDSGRLDSADLATRSDAIRGLQILLREGSRVTLGVFACGAAGRVIMLNSVR